MNINKVSIPNLSIKKITAKETYAVRHPVLREGRPLIDCKFENDDDTNTFHLGLYIENKLLGVVTFIKNKHPEIQGKSYQLRGMAVLKEHQRRGFGNLLIQKGETIIRLERGTVIWCNAREIAVNFYKKNDFKIIGNSFNIPKIGLHYTMYKML